MKEIGLKLKNKREENGLSVNEVAEDLKVKFSDIQNLEEGSRESFKDIIFLKSLIADYAKYLGFDSDQMLDEFNEYLFDQTSRISLEDIKKARELKDEEEQEKVISPYTLNKKVNSRVPLFVGAFVIVLLIVFFVSYFFVIDIVRDNQEDEKNVSYMIGGN